MDSIDDARLRGLSWRDAKRAWEEAVAELDEIERSAGMAPTRVTPKPYLPNPSVASRD